MHISHAYSHVYLPCKSPLHLLPGVPDPRVVAATPVSSTGWPRQAWLRAGMQPPCLGLSADLSAGHSCHIHKVQV
jgi:hypothetical protein